MCSFRLIFLSTLYTQIRTPLSETDFLYGAGLVIPALSTRSVSCSEIYFFTSVMGRSLHFVENLKAQRFLK